MKEKDGVQRIIEVKEAEVKDKTEMETTNKVESFKQTKTKVETLKQAKTKVETLKQAKTKIETEKEPKKSKKIVVKTIKSGASLIARTGDFVGRLGTLMVMIVTSINTGTTMVTSFIEGVYWRGGVYAFLLAFIHIPMIVVMVWIMVKAKVQAMYRKIRPSRPGEVVTVTDVENEETVVYEETIQEVEELDPEAASDRSVQALEHSNVPKTVNIDSQPLSTEKVKAVKKEVGKIKQQKLETKLADGMKNAEQINKAFDWS